MHPRGANSRVMNTRVLLKRRPSGEPSAGDFEIVHQEIPRPAQGELLLQTRFLSIDPYMRGRMSAAKSYAAPVEIGSVMVGATVSEVVESRNDAFQTGELVADMHGWQTHAISDGRGLRKLDPALGPPSYALGILGMPGMTAYFALTEIGKPKPGETVVVSAAAGAVGSVAGQIAKILGCRTVGVAGSAEKCRYLTEELGFDACINRRTEKLDDALSAACPEGIDVYFDNTAGPVLEAVLRHLRLHARIPLVGLIDQYNATEVPKGPNLAPLLVNRALIRGFLVSDYEARAGEFLAQMAAWIREGKLRYREDVVEGIENAPAALLRVLRGENFGKQLVRI